MPHLDPPAERLEIPFEGGIIPGNLRRPKSVQPPLVLMVPGLDSSKEELFAIENDFLQRGLATLTIDGPGQSENSVNFAIRPNWETVITPLLDHLSGLDLGVDQDRVGLMGISMGAIYGPRAAAYEKRIRALVGLAGPYNLGECWDALNPLTRGGYIFYTKSADDAEAKRKAYTPPLPAVSCRADRARGRQRDAGHLPGRQPRMQQHRLQVPPANGGLATRAADYRKLGARCDAAAATGPVAAAKSASAPGPGRAGA